MDDGVSIIPVERIERAIVVVRFQKVMLASDLAGLYGIDVKVLNQAVKRNLNRFPSDFMFQLTEGEFQLLRSQIVTLEAGRGKYTKYMPYAFTEQGVAMLSSVLRSPRAVQVNIEIMRAFVSLRRMLATNEDLRRKLLAMERKYDGQFRVVFEAIRELMEPPEDPPKKRIGFATEAES